MICHEDSSPCYSRRQFQEQMQRKQMRDDEGCSTSDRPLPRMMEISKLPGNDQKRTISSSITAMMTSSSNISSSSHRYCNGKHGVSATNERNNNNNEIAVSHPSSNSKTLHTTRAAVSTKSSTVSLLAACCLLTLQTIGFKNYHASALSLSLPRDYCSSRRILTGVPTTTTTTRLGVQTTSWMTIDSSLAGDSLDRSSATTEQPQQQQNASSSSSSSSSSSNSNERINSTGSSSSNSINTNGSTDGPSTTRKTSSASSSPYTVGSTLKNSKSNNNNNHNSNKNSSSTPKNKINNNNNKNNNNNNNNNNNRPKKRKYNRKLPLLPSEKAAALARRRRQAAYEKMRTSSLNTKNEPPSIWSFDSLFPAPVLDKWSVREDLYGRKEREEEVRMRRERSGTSGVNVNGGVTGTNGNVNGGANGGANGSAKIGVKEKGTKSTTNGDTVEKEIGLNGKETKEGAADATFNGDDTGTTIDAITNGSTTSEEPSTLTTDPDSKTASSKTKKIADAAFNAALAAGVPLPPRPDPKPQKTIDKQLTRMVEDRIYGYMRSSTGSTSLLDSSRAVQFREGVRLGKALSINVDRLVHFAKKELSHGRLEEAQEFYMKAISMDASDGRAYLGLSRIAQRRGDWENARNLLKEGIGKCGGGFVEVKGPTKNGSSNISSKESGKKKNNKNDNDDEEEEARVLGTIDDNGPNPFLLQALGTLEQKSGNLSAAEELYLAAVRSRPSHAAAWVSLAQLRTKELRQGANAGRACYQSAERELSRIGAKPNAFVYTAWASLEYKKGGDTDSKSKSVQRARELYQLALDADPRCSVAYLQLGVMESECANFERAKECFEAVLKFDQRNSRVIQAYAIMESRRPREEVDSRTVLDLFEKALKANPRDAGVYQAYALYVVQLGDIDSARDLLRRGTEVDKRHAPVWQAWGVLETRYSTAKDARDVFQQGIWSCASACGGQSGGRRCARLWQAWGVLESQEGDHEAARRCFSRALDADPRNVAAVTAWTLMEADVGNFGDARSIFERTLKVFPSLSDDKMSLWRAYEIMEERAGNTRTAQQIFQRSMREAMSSRDEELDPINTTSNVDNMISAAQSKAMNNASSNKGKNKEVEVSRWNTAGDDSMDAEVWMNKGAIEGKVPAKLMNKMRKGDSIANRRKSQ